MMTLIFWGGFLLAIFGALRALFRRSWGWMLVSLIGYLPFALYLQATPKFQGYIFVLLFHIIAIYALASNKRRVAEVSMALTMLSTIGVFLMLG
jgi:hypothetical protein